jgi:hypothetical protein
MIKSGTIMIAHGVWGLGIGIMRNCKYIEKYIEMGINTKRSVIPRFWVVSIEPLAETNRF